MGAALKHPEEKVADVPAAVEEEIKRRWSPRSFADREVTDEQLRVLLEAARWAPSSFNEQPWRFIVAKREDTEEFERLLGCFNAKNREWAAGASVIMLTATRKRFQRTGRVNRHAYHDVGLAMGNLVNQAMSMELYVHQMAGIDPLRARETFRVPADYDIVSGVAIGYLGDPSDLDDPNRREAETRERSRKPLQELVFARAWGETASFVEAHGT